MYVDRWCYTVIGSESTDVFSFDAYLFALFLNKSEMGTTELQLLLIAMAAESWWNNHNGFSSMLL